MGSQSGDEHWRQEERPQSVQRRRTRPQTALKISQPISRQQKEEEPLLQVHVQGQRGLQGAQAREEREEGSQPQQKPILKMSQSMKIEEFPHTDKISLSFEYYKNPLIFR